MHDADTRYLLGLHGSLFMTEEVDAVCEAGHRTADSQTQLAPAETETGSSKRKRLGETGHSLSAKYNFH